MKRKLNMNRFIFFKTFAIVLVISIVFNQAMIFSYANDITLVDNYKIDDSVDVYEVSDNSNNSSSFSSSYTITPDTVVTPDILVDNYTIAPDSNNLLLGATVASVATETYADFTFTMPTSVNDGTVYSVTVYIQRDLDDVDYSHTWGKTETYNISGTTTSSITFPNTWLDVYGNSQSTLYATIENVAAGETITIEDILIALPDEWVESNYSYNQTYISLAITSSEQEETITVEPATTLLVEDSNILATDAIQIGGAIDTTVRTYGDLTFTLPTTATDYNGDTVNLDADTLYTISVYIQRTYQGYEFTPNGYEDYAVYTDGKDDRAFRLTAGWFDIFQDGSSYGAYSGSLTNISPGDILTIGDILLSQLDATLSWAEQFDTTFATIIIESSNPLETIVVSDIKIELLADTSVPIANITSSLSSEINTDNIQQLTDDTLSPDGNDILFLLSNYNVVSLKDIEATHIVGPIIAQEGAYRTGNEYSSGGSADDYDADYLIASDYSRGVSSYVGVLKAIDHSPYDSTFKLNYGFEVIEEDENGFEWQTDFTPPNFYTRATDFYDNSILVGVSQETLDHEVRDVINLYSEDPVISFFSPNNEGRVENYSINGILQEQKTLTLQNDMYIDFDNYWDDVTYASEYLLEYGSLTDDISDEVIVINAYQQTSLTLEAGYSYLIQNANVLETVDIDFPEDEDGNEIYDFFHNPYPETTIINFDGQTINPTTIDGKLVSQFPLTLINGEVLDALAGDGGEYSEIGNKIIWNLPNVVTSSSGTNRLVFSTVGPNVAGHIIAPSAELWNYYESESGVITWGGGNLNGTAIVADFHGGYMEMHMWAYSGLEEISTSVHLSVTKDYQNGNLENQSFDFQLSAIESANYSGLSDTIVLPYTSSSDENGNIRFPSMIFEVDYSVDYPKEYVFTLNEIIPDTPRSDITYDDSIYTITVTVDMDSKYVNEIQYNTLTSDYTIEKSNSDGSDSSKVTDIVFTNVKDTSVASYSFTKITDNGYTLNGAEFLLSTDIDDWTDAVTYISGYGKVENIASISSITLENGIVTFENLELDTTYYFKEVVAPTGYQLSDGFWMLDVNEYGEVFITACDGAVEITNHQIINYASEDVLVDVTLTKQSDTGQTLSGAVFVVERVLSLTQHTVVEGGYHGEFTSGDDGQLVITGLMQSGIYKITETIAPDGYMIPEAINFWLLDVQDDGSVDIYSPNLYEVDPDGNLSLQEGLQLINISAYMLPVTGKNDIYKYQFIGIFLIFSSSIFYLLNKKKRGFNYET